jgi:hypothetical protein
VCVGGICQTSRPPEWAAAGVENASALRFKGCTFTVVDPAGKKYEADVTAVLNGMAIAYRGATTPVPRTLRLDRPLNAFSFIIKGVNDSATVASPTEAARWATSATTLTGLVRTV